jgi:hypothetical protein
MCFLNSGYLWDSLNRKRDTDNASLLQNASSMLIPILYNSSSILLDSIAAPVNRTAFALAAISIITSSISDDLFLNQEYTDFFDIPDRSDTCSMVMLSYPSSINIDFVTARTFFLRSRISSRLGRPIRVNCLRGAFLTLMTRRRRSDLMSRRVKVVGRRTECSGHWLVIRPQRGPNAPISKTLWGGRFAGP